MSEPGPETLDDVDKRIINQLQTGFPLCPEPYAEAAREFEITESELIARLTRLLETNHLTRFGPMYDADEIGGGLTLAAMEVPDDEFEKVAACLDGLKEIAHNYEREHRLNMWFVVATEHRGDIERVLRKIEVLTGLTVYNLPRQRSFFVNLYLPVS